MAIVLQNILDSKSSPVSFDPMRVLSKILRPVMSQKNLRLVMPPKNSFSNECKSVLKSTSQLLSIRKVTTASKMFPPKREK